MKTVNAATTENTTTFYINQFGDVQDTPVTNDHEHIVGHVIVDDFFVGSVEQMRDAALEKYLTA